MYVKHNLIQIAKGVGMFKNYLSRGPLLCTLQVTYRCNFFCSFCDYWKTTEREKLTVADYEAISETLSEIGTMAISIAGGEPLLRRDLTGVIRALARHHLVTLVTNGWLVNERKAQAFIDAGLAGVSISIDSSRAEEHDRQRGIEGSFERAIDALRIFARLKPGLFVVNLINVLMDDNIQRVEELLQLTRDLGVGFTLQPVTGLKAKNNPHFLTRPVSADLIALKRKYPNFGNTEAFLARFDDYVAGGVPDCLAGISMFNVDDKGDVSICMELTKQPLGNILHDDLDGLLARLKAAHAGNTCTACWYNCRGEYELMHREGLSYFWNRAWQTIRLGVSGSLP